MGPRRGRLSARPAGDGGGGEPVARRGKPRPGRASRSDLVGLWSDFAYTGPNGKHNIAADFLLEKSEHVSGFQLTNKGVVKRKRRPLKARTINLERGGGGPVTQGGLAPNRLVRRATSVPRLAGE